ncbi:VF530 family protein [Limibacter armeniacum]|uniref:VF530 family protein n=1 Tax=Limibacter armeniacum TaxID=466084 RepID=UPI002FE54B28
MMEEQKNNPLHGKKLADILEELVKHYEWSRLGYLIKINCFTSNPSIKSSLKFLRRTPWAKKQVEDLYIETFINRDNN